MHKEIFSARKIKKQLITSENFFSRVMSIKICISFFGCHEKGGESLINFIFYFFLLLKNIFFYDFSIAIVQVVRVMNFKEHHKDTG